LDLGLWSLIFRQARARFLTDLGLGNVSFGQTFNINHNSGTRSALQKPKAKD